MFSGLNWHKLTNPDFYRTAIDNNIVFRYIYSFHMPLFMYISGFVSYRQFFGINLIGRRFFQLIVPFVSWAMLSMAIGGEWNFNWLFYPDSGLWFLWVLFWISCAFVGISKFSTHMKISEEIIIAVACSVFIGVLFVSKLSFGYNLFAWYLPFYCMGALNRKYYDKVMPMLYRLRWVLTVCFICSAYFWMRNESPTFMHTNSSAIIFLYKFFVGVTGSLWAMSMLQYFNDKIMIISELGGGMTLGIYAIHQPVINALLKNSSSLLHIDNLCLEIVVVFIITLSMTLLFYNVLSRVKITSFMLLGKK